MYIAPQYHINVNDVVSWWGEPRVVRFSVVVGHVFRCHFVVVLQLWIDEKSVNQFFMSQAVFQRERMKSSQKQILKITVMQLLSVWDTNHWCIKFRPKFVVIIEGLLFPSLDELFLSRVLKNHTYIPCFQSVLLYTNEPIFIQSMEGFNKNFKKRKTRK